MKKLENKVAVITGGNSGIGLAVAELFAHHGAKVAITGRDEVSLTKAIGRIKGAIGIKSDVSNIKSISGMYEEIHTMFGKIDILVLNAGIDIPGPLSSYTEESFDTISAVNFKGVFFSVQKALPYLNDGASIVLTSSAVNEKGFPGNAVYAATKAAVRSLARSLSTELISRNIRVNVVSPGAVDTPFFARGGATEEQLTGVKEYMANIIPARRLGKASEVAHTYLFLASDDSAYMLGSEVVVDGGVKTL